MINVTVKHGNNTRQYSVEEGESVHEVIRADGRFSTANTFHLNSNDGPVLAPNHRIKDDMTIMVG